MKRHKPVKGFDCIEFKRQAQAEIYQEIKGLSPEQEMEYFRRRVAAGPFGKLWKTLETRSRPADSRTPLAAAAPRHPVGRGRKTTAIVAGMRPAAPRRIS
jgi:hypothetical protein